MRKITKAGVLGLLVAACSGDFDPQSKVDSVRMFAVRADKPYAKPGETVELEVLLTDARKDKAQPLKLYWIPLVCMNPRDDLYYLCFLPGDGGIDAGATFVAAGDGGADAGAGFGGGLSSIPTGVDLGPFLPQGPKYSFKMPENAVQPRDGIDPYGLAVLFNVACPGRLEFVSTTAGGSPQQVPLKCSDANGNALLPKDYVIGISRVYAYDTRTNANPIIEQTLKDDVAVDLAAGITVEPCREAKRADCKDIHLDLRVPDESWEANPAETTSVREQIWVDWYSDIGDFSDDARLLFDTKQGRTSESFNKFHAPADPQDGTIWAVVHDNRGGANWVVFPVHVR